MAIERYPPVLQLNLLVECSLPCAVVKIIDCHGNTEMLYDGVNQAPGRHYQLGRYWYSHSLRLLPKLPENLA